MKRILIAASLIFFVAVFGNVSAQANTDQHCLDLCTRSGTKSDTCLGQCTYNGSDATTKNNPPSTNATVVPNSSLAEKNNILKAPEPMANGVLPSHAPVKKPSADKDYACMSQCLKNGMQYQLCEKTCTKQDCPSGKILCKDPMMTGQSATSAPVLQNFKSQ